MVLPYINMNPPQVYILDVILLCSLGQDQVLVPHFISESLFEAKYGMPLTRRIGHSRPQRCPMICGAGQTIFEDLLLPVLPEVLTHPDPRPTLWGAA